LYSVYSKPKRSGLRTLRNVVISIFVLMILFMGGGIAYIKFYGPSSNAKANQSPIDTTPDLALPKPPKISPNAPESAALESITSPVKAGENTAISVKTNPDSVCTINVTYNNVPAKDSGLTPKPSGVYGNVTWSWTVDKSAPAGKWPVKVTCVYTKNKKSGVVIGDLQITK
jgi:hypothetical protein